MSRKVYFPVLDMLRFIASLLVLLCHSPELFEAELRNRIHFCVFIRNAGEYGVAFFYVLSGFLITYLLLREKESTGSINVRAFYTRRMLRIWPLYYLLFFLTYAVFAWFSPWKQWFTPGVYWAEFILYLIFLPNIAVYPGGVTVPTFFQTHTVGYEEQFYLVWPWLIRGLRKGLPVLMVIVFLGHPLLELFHLYFIAHVQGGGRGIFLAKSVMTLIYLSNMPAFVAGGFAGWLFCRGGLEKMRVLMWRGWIYPIVMMVLLLMIFADVRLLGFVNLLAVLFAWLILLLVRIRWEPGKWGSWLVRGGKVSYGIYMYHPAVLIVVSASLGKSAIARWLPPTGVYILHLLLSVMLTILVAAVSYRFIEKRFLARKQRFEPRG